MIANGYAHRMPHKPSSNRLDSGPQIFRKSFEFQPNGNATHPTIMLIAVNEKNYTKIGYSSGEEIYRTLQWHVIWDIWFNTKIFIFSRQNPKFTRKKSFFCTFLWCHNISWIDKSISFFISFIWFRSFLSSFDKWYNIMQWMNTNMRWAHTKASKLIFAHFIEKKKT